METIKTCFKCGEQLLKENSKLITFGCDGIASDSPILKSEVHEQPLRTRNPFTCFSPEAFNQSCTFRIFW